VVTGAVSLRGGGAKPAVLAAGELSTGALGKPKDALLTYLLDATMVTNK